MHNTSYDFFCEGVHILLRGSHLYKKLLPILLLSLMPVLCDAEQKTAHQIVQETSEQVLDVLKRDKDAIRKNPNKINALVDGIILPVCDVERMSKYILAKHWKTASDDQRTKFTNEFKQMLIRTYGKYMVEYSDASVTVLPEKDIEKKKYRVVSTELNLRDGGKPLHVDYVFRSSDDAEKIIDVRVEGISVLKMFRTIYTYEIALTSLEELIERLTNENQPSLAMHTGSR